MAEVLDRGDERVCMDAETAHVLRPTRLAIDRGCDIAYVRYRPPEDALMQVYLAPRADGHVGVFYARENAKHQGLVNVDVGRNGVVVGIELLSLAPEVVSMAVEFARRHGMEWPAEISLPQPVPDAPILGA